MADGRGANSDAQKAVDFDRAACLVVLIEKVKPENEVAVYRARLIGHRIGV